MLQRAVVLSVMLVLFGVAAAGAWVLVGSTLRSKPPSASGRAIDLGGVEVRVLPEWASAAPSDAGLEGLTGRVAAFATAPGLTAYAVVLLAPRELPRALLAKIGPLGSGRRTELAGLAARHYAPRPVPGDRMADLTVARTAAGLLAVACIARTAAWTAASGCATEVAASGA